MKNLLTLLTLLGLTGVAAAVPVPADKQAYVGEWTGNGVELSISAGGAVTYKQTNGAYSKSLSGSLIEFVGPSLRIDAFIVKGMVNVEEAPHEDRGVWVMTVGGAKVMRKPPTLLRHQRAEVAIRDHFRNLHVAVSKVLCTADADSADVFACVIQTDLGDSFVTKCAIDAKGTMDWKVSDVALIDGTALVAFIEKMHADKFHAKMVAKCAPGIIMKRVGTKFTCDGVAGPKTYKVTILVKDTAGNVSIDY